MRQRTATIWTGLGLVVLALGIVYAVWLGQANRAVARAYAALEADGRPVRADQVIPPAVADTDNAALLYEAVALQLKAEAAGEQDLFTLLDERAAAVLADPANTAARDAFAELLPLGPVAGARAAISQASRKPACRFDVNYGDGASMVLPHLSDMRVLSKLLAATVQVQAAGGNHDAAWDSARTGLRLAQALVDEPILISQLVRIEQFRMTAAAIQALAEDAQPADGEWTKIEMLLREFEDATLFVDAIDGERLLFGEWGFQLPARPLHKAMGPSQGFKPRLGLAVALLPPVLRRDYAAYIGFMHAGASQAAKPYSPVDRTFASDLLRDVPRYCSLTRMMAPALSAAKSRFMLMVAQARLTRVGLAALAHRNATGSYPENLAELDLEDLSDPFRSDQPLQYRATPTGFLVYSVGEDQVDDDGRAAQDDAAGDIAWQLGQGP